MLLHMLFKTGVLEGSSYLDRSHQASTVPQERGLLWGERRKGGSEDKENKRAKAKEGPAFYLGCDIMEHW